MNAMRRYLSWFLLGASALIFAASESRAASRDVEAIWRVQRFDFTYRGESQYYSCNELAARLTEILHAVGAHPQSRVFANCGSGLRSSLRATITIASPVEATVDNVRAATTFTPSDVLLAHVKKISLPTPSDIERFPARWQRISLHRIGDLDLSSADCELIHGLAQQVLPNLSVKVVREVTWCASATRPQLVVEALVPTLNVAVMFTSD
jgi:hypothetical protein